MINETETTGVELAEQVVQYVMTVTDEQFAGLTVSKLAVYFEVDRFRLSRQFKKTKHMTLDSFLSKEKMHRAAAMLAYNKEMSVKEVSQKIGFCTSDYFIRVFREYFGVVPGRYKQFKTERSGIGDRRKREKDRRKRILKSSIPPNGDRRKGKKERRNGSKDRRKSNPPMPSHEEVFQYETHTAKNCADCRHNRYKDLRN